MKDKPENPQAFPLSTIDGFSHDGMDLRDYFASKAIEHVESFVAETIAVQAYLIADAMLAERSKSDE